MLKTKMESYQLPSRKAQLVSTEFLIIVFILIAFFSFAIFLWNFASQKIKERVDLTELELTAFELSDQLIVSQGLPDDWHEREAATTAVGLIKNNYVLEKAKVKTFVNLSYENLKNKIGLNQSDFYFRLLYLNNSIAVDENGKQLSTGKFPANASVAVNSRRTALLENEIVYVDVIVWR